jgi:hypothetical protein
MPIFSASCSKRKQRIEAGTNKVGATSLNYRDMYYGTPCAKRRSSGISNPKDETEVSNEACRSDYQAIQAG